MDEDQSPTAQIDDGVDIPPDAPETPARESDDLCWCCAGQTIKRHCKIVCTNCGFMRDCSDP